MTVNLSEHAHPANMLGDERAAEQRLIATSAPRWQRHQVPLPTVRLTAANLTILGFTEESARADLDLSPAYQRGSVWNAQQQRDLIRSILMGVSIGAVIRSVRDHRDPRPMYKIVDGKQRIEAIHQFVDDNLDVPADWFNDDELDIDNIPPHGQITYRHLTKVGRRRFSNHTIAVSEFHPTVEWVQVPAGTGDTGSNMQFITRERTEAEIVAYEAMVFGLLNSAGTPQTADSLAAAARIAESARLDLNDPAS